MVRRHTGRRPSAKVAIGVASLLLASLAVTGCATGCPTAQLEGTLAAADGELVVERDPAGVAIHVHWPFGVGVRDDDGELVLTDVLGTVKAREGDVVAMAGSSPDDGSWVACGDVTVTGRQLRQAPNE